MLSLSVVIPVYRGEATLGSLLAEIAALAEGSRSPEGRRFQVTEVLLVWDGGTSASADAIRILAQQYAFVHPVWLSRNFGQHPATLAGITSSSGAWVVTLDEDGQHDPASIGSMLDAAFTQQAELIYATPVTPPPHPWLRNVASRITKWLFVRVLASQDVQEFNSYRLIQGDVARSTAAYTGSGVYLDVALSWVVSRIGTCRVEMRTEGRPPGSYTMGRLFSHFGRLLVSSGTRPLAFVSVLGFVVFFIGAMWSVWILWQSLSGAATPPGWTSTFVGLLLIGGLILFSLGVIAQYVRIAAESALGRPLYIVVSDPHKTFGMTPEDR